MALCWSAKYGRNKRTTEVWEDWPESSHHFAVFSVDNSDQTDHRIKSENAQRMREIREGEFLEE